MDKLTTDEVSCIIAQLEQDLKDKQEELDSQRGMLSAAVDELVKYNESLTNALRLIKERNQELERLLYQASHGLRSPITSVLGIIQLFKYEPLSETAKSYINHIERRSAHMMEIMNSLSSLSKLTGANVKPDFVNIDEIIQTNIHDISKLNEAHQVQVHYESTLSDNLIKSDTFLLKEILKQIIMNGIIFRTPGKKGNLWIKSKTENDQLVVLIKDDGNGIDPAIRNQVFEMFFRGSEKSGGSGLGLYIAKKAADLLHGSITFTSSPTGTTFRVQIPTIFTASSTESAYLMNN